jgi:hypothetical protein
MSIKVDQRLIVLVDVEMLRRLKERSFHSQPHARVGEIVRRAIEVRKTEEGTDRFMYDEIDLGPGAGDAALARQQEAEGH